MHDLAGVLLAQTRSKKIDQVKSCKVRSSGSLVWITKSCLGWSIHCNHLLLFETYCNRFCLFLVVIKTWSIEIFSVLNSLCCGLSMIK